MQIFGRGWNLLPRQAAIFGIGGLASLVLGVNYWGSPSFTQIGYSPKQPVAYSHKLHARDNGIDCRYCHAMVERSSVAMIPPTQTCMNCHQLVKNDSPKLALIRESWQTGKRIEWIRIHKLPDHAYFDHSVHVTVGVGCSTCHGRVDEMEQVRQAQPLSMGWCLECHREVRRDQGASPNIRPVSQITNMDWKPDPARPTELTRRLDPPENCSACHR